MDDFDAIEGHNSQLIFPRLFNNFPIFKNYTQKINKQTQKFAEEYDKPWIATSDAHRIEDLGVSYIEFEGNLLNINDGEEFLESLKSIIKQGSFTKSCNYENKRDWVNWVYTFKKGLRSEEREEQDWEFKTNN